MYSTATLCIQGCCWGRQHYVRHARTPCICIIYNKHAREQAINRLTETVFCFSRTYLDKYPLYVVGIPHPQHVVGAYLCGYLCLIYFVPAITGTSFKAIGCVV